MRGGSRAARRTGGRLVQVIWLSCILLAFLAFIVASQIKQVDHPGVPTSSRPQAQSSPQRPDVVTVRHLARGGTGQASGASWGALMPGEGPPSRAELPPTCAAALQHERAGDGMDLNQTSLDLSFRAPPSEDVELLDVRVHRDESTAPAKAYRMYCAAASYSPWPEPTEAKDEVAASKDSEIRVDLSAEATNVTAPVLLNGGESRVVPVSATLESGSYAWSLELELRIGSATRSVLLNDEGKPFRTVAEALSTDPVRSPQRDLPASWAAEAGLEHVWTVPPAAGAAMAQAEGMQVYAGMGSGGFSFSDKTTAGQYRLHEYAWVMSVLQSEPPALPLHDMDCPSLYSWYRQTYRAGTGLSDIVLAVHVDQPTTVTGVHMRILARKPASELQQTNIMCANARHRSVSSGGYAIWEAELDADTGRFEIGDGPTTPYFSLPDGQVVRRSIDLDPSSFFDTVLKIATFSRQEWHSFVLDLNFIQNGKKRVLTINDGGRPFEQGFQARGVPEAVYCEGAPRLGWTKGSQEKDPCPGATSPTPPPVTS
jgi:hypothetical protein